MNKIPFTEYKTKIKKMPDFFHDFLLEEKKILQNIPHKIIDKLNCTMVFDYKHHIHEKSRDVFLNDNIDIFFKFPS